MSDGSVVVGIVASAMEREVAEIDQLIARIGELFSSGDRARQQSACILTLNLLQIELRSRGKREGVDLEPLARTLSSMMAGLQDLRQGRRSGLLTPVGSAAKAGRRSIGNHEWIARSFAAAAVDARSKLPDGETKAIAYRKVARDIQVGLEHVGVRGFPRNWHHRSIERYREDLRRGVDCGPDAEDGVAYDNYHKCLAALANEVRTVSLYRLFIEQAVLEFSMAFEPEEPQRSR